MILENSKLLKEQLGNTLIFVYPLNFNDVEKYATIEIEGIGANRNISVYLGEESRLQDATPSVLGDILKTSDIKLAWEKFEDIFNQSDEGESQNGEEPEIVNLFITFEPNRGETQLFVQNVKLEQQVIFLFYITDKILLSSQPNVYSLDFSDNQDMPEQFRAKWFLANTNGDVKLQGTDNSFVTYQVAIESVSNPTEQPTDEPPTDEPPTDEPPQGGQPTDEPPSDEPPTDTPPTDEPPQGGQPTDEPPTDAPPTDTPPMDEPPMDEPPMDEQSTGTPTSSATYDSIITTIATESNLSKSEVLSSFRNEDSFKDFIEINNVNWRKIANQLGLSDNLNKFASEVIKINNPK